MFNIISINNDGLTTEQAFVRVADLFDPRRPVVPVSLNQWKSILTSFYSDINIEDNFELMFPNLKGALVGRDAAIALLKSIPENFRWLYYYMNLRQAWSGADAYNIYVLKPLDPQIASGCLHFYTQYTNTMGEILLTDHTTFQSIIVASEDHWRDVLLQHGNNPIHIGQPMLDSPTTPFLESYLKFLTNAKLFIQNNGSACTRTTALTSLQNNPDLVVKINFLNEGRISITLTQPVTKLNKSLLYTVQNYSSNPMSMLEWPIKGKDEHDPILYGVELELATNYSIMDIIEASDEPFFIAKTDSSVNGKGTYRLELATVPMSLKAHKQQWAHWISSLDYANFDCSTDTNNGMHVHIGNDAFADKAHTTKFVWFFTQPAHQAFMMKFSQRTPKSWQTYSAVPEPVLGRTRVATYQRNDRAVMDLRGCVHYSPKGTIEVRMFKGIVSLADIIKNLEFVDSVFHFTLQGFAIQKLTLQDYITWLNKQPRNKYSVIKKYLNSSEKLMKLVKASNLEHLIFNESDPSKILQLIQKHKYVANNETVTLLNQHLKKRVFIFNKETKTIQINTTPSDDFAAHNRAIEMRILGRSRTTTPNRPGAV